MKKLSFFVAAIFMITVICGCAITKNCVAKIDNNYNKSLNKTVINVWHLDLLEGGKGSRASWLQNAAKKLKAKDEKIEIIIQNHSKFSCEENFKKGIYPDLISYSYGLDGIDSLFKKINLKSNNGVFIGKGIYALDFAYNCYVLISKDNSVSKSGKVLYVSQNDTNMPMISYYLEDLKFEKIVNNRPISAYTDFLADSDGTLLGTLRDIFRLQKRGVEFTWQPLTKFSDMRYFVSVLNKDKYNECVDFICVLTEDMQSEVEKLGLVSVKGDQSDEILKQVQSVRTAQTLYGYPTYKTIKEINKNLYDIDKSDEEKLNTIKNVLK